MIIYDIDKDLNVSLSFPDHATLLTLKTYLSIILGSKQKKFNNIEAWKEIKYSHKKVCFTASKKGKEKEDFTRKQLSYHKICISAGA